MSDQPKCELCGFPMPEGEEVFVMHGYSGPCPGPPLPAKPTELETLKAENQRLREALEQYADKRNWRKTQYVDGDVWDLWIGRNNGYELAQLALEPRK